MSGTSLGEFALLSRLLGKKVRLSLRSQTGFLNITRTLLYHDVPIVPRSQLENAPWDVVKQESCITEPTNLQRRYDAIEST